MRRKWLSLLIGKVNRCVFMESQVQARPLRYALEEKGVGEAGGGEALPWEVG